MSQLELTLKDIVTDEELKEVWENANFGSATARDIVKYGILKVVCGRHQGSASRRILEDLDLIDSYYNITAKGQAYLWKAFKAPGSITWR